MELKGKSCIITGATSGMGKGVAELFAHQGAKLILNGRDKQRGNDLVNALRPINPDIHFYAGDVADPQLNEKLVKKAVEHFGRLDVISTHAGMLGLGNVVDVDMETWHKTFDVNLHAVFYLCRYGIPEMLKTGGGTLVINASIAAFKSFPNHPAYCASKAGLVAFTKQVAVDYGPTLRANVICPGPVDTPLIWDSAKAFPNPSKAVEDAGQNTVMKRLGLPQDIAQLVCFLASEQSSWMTGSVITIDGGVTLR